jgi:hypothetical protein
VQKYPVRASHRKNLEPSALASILRSHFESVGENGETVVASWGAIERLSARRDAGGLTVDLTMNPKVPDTVASETIARYNRFLEEATGYGAKERARRLRKSAKSEPTGD